MAGGVEVKHLHVAVVEDERKLIDVLGVAEARQAPAETARAGPWQPLEHGAVSFDLALPHVLNEGT